MKILALPDSHYPFQHPDYFKYISAILRYHKPDRVVHLGDIVDKHALSKYPKSTRSKGAVWELEESIKIIKKLSLLIPEMTITIGNHDRRLVQLAATVGIDPVFLRDLRDILRLPSGWKLVKSIIYDGVRYIHGDEFHGRDTTYKLMMRYGQSIVHGHEHSNAKVFYTQLDSKLLFGVSSGCLVDTKSYAFEYVKINTQVLGYTVVTDGIPQFYPMVTKKNGRWVGKL